MDADDPKEFPDVSHKLAAPKKLSAFEKERQATLAKQQRAEEENAAALKAFENSFAADDDDHDSLGSYMGGRGPPAGPRGGHGGYSGLRSGPRSLAFDVPPPPSLKRKRALDEMREAQEARREQQEALEYAGQQDSAEIPLASTEGDAAIDAPRPTLRLSCLPLDISEQTVTDLFKNQFKINSLVFHPPADLDDEFQRTQSATVTLDHEVSSSQIEAAITALKDKYLGCGHHLSISRQLSSATIHAAASAAASVSTEPFGAERHDEAEAGFSFRTAPPPMDQRGFAPPECYDGQPPPDYTTSDGNEAIISVRPPLDLETIKAIHTVVESLLLEPDPARALKMEAMLMNLDAVKEDERFAFLFDSQNPAGIYYRFLLWGPDHVDDAERDCKRRDLSIERIHEDADIQWHPPYEQLPFPDLKSLDQVVTDIDYVSSDEESDDEDAERQFNSDGGEGGSDQKIVRKHLLPLQRARFVHLLSRLPTSNARLRKGDVARVTNFAINHAGSGAEEIVDLLLLNISKPFCYTSAAKYDDSDDEQTGKLDSHLPTLGSLAPEAPKENKRDDDPSNAKLIGLYLCSDILSASSTAGARNAWKYRQLFESGFRVQNTFEHLGRLDRELGWGRLKAEQWKRKVGVLFGIWEGWSVFSSDVQEEMKQSFYTPPLSEAEQRVAAEDERRKKEEKWKRVGHESEPPASKSPSVVPVAATAVPEQVVEDVDGAPLDDLDGVPMGEDDLEGEPLVDDFDGQAMDDVDGAPMTDDVDRQPTGTMKAGGPVGGLDGPSSVPPAASTVKTASAAAEATLTSKATGPRRRMRAEDMFADSDED